MKRVAVSGLILALAGLSGCGDDDGSDAAPDAAPGAGATVQSTPSASTTPKARGERVNRQWELVSIDGKDISIRVDSRPCETEPQLSTAELDDYVEIETYAYVLGEDCKQLPRKQWATPDMTLRKPLGDRDLVGCEPFDGSIDCRTGKLRTKPAATSEP